MQSELPLVNQEQLRMQQVHYNVLSKYAVSSEKRQNAAIVILCRNSDIQGISKTLKNFEAVFNHKFGYPYVFLNDKPFTKEFKQKITGLSLKGASEFGLIPTAHWSYPAWIDQEKAAECRKEMTSRKVLYAESESYRHMCRFNSGFFFKHPLLLAYRYYWRIEPDVEFFCPIDYDPFAFMHKEGKTYGFTIALGEIPETVPSLWDTTKQFMLQNTQTINFQSNLLSFFTTPNSAQYNLCHFWSNFEIADMEFWRSPAYSAYFEHLDKAGGFFYERWGDAPVHSLAVGMFLPKEKVHFFADIGYNHPPFQHCPSIAKCKCKVQNTFDWQRGSCLRRWLTL